MSKIPSYDAVVIGNFWKNCGNCKFSDASAINGKLHCERKEAPKKMRKDRLVDLDGLCGYHKHATIPF